MRLQESCVKKDFIMSHLRFQMSILDGLIRYIERNTNSWDEYAREQFGKMLMSFKVLQKL